MREAIRCKDGSWTLRNEEVGESYHTPLGAAMEAREKFAAACDLPARAAKGKVVILDVCYGLGYNTAAALESIRGSDQSCEVAVYGLESDRTIVKDALGIPFPFADKELFSSLAEGFEDDCSCFAAQRDGVSLRVLIGDARERIHEVPHEADVVFFDAFSPRRQPEMWTARFFSDIFEKCADDAVLVTYSCARRVRENMREAGFIVEDGPVVGRRGPATVGRVAKHS